METELEKAMKVVIKALKEDEGYKIAWVANIAMAFKDEWGREDFQQSEQQFENVHKLANTAAKNFINQLCIQ